MTIQEMVKDQHAGKNKEIIDKLSYLHVKQYDNILMARYCFNEMVKDIQSGSFVDEEVSRRHKRDAENFIIYSQGVSLIDDKVSGEFKNYILGEYSNKKKDKDQVDAAISDSYKMEGYFQKAEMDLYYNILLLIGEARKSGYAVFDKEIKTGVSLSFAEAIALSNKLEEGELFFDINRGAEKYVNIQLKKNRETGDYNMSFVLSSRLEVKKGKGIISIKSEARKIIEDMTGEEGVDVEVTDNEYSDLVVETEDTTFLSLIPEGVEKRLSRKKIRRINNLLGRETVFDCEDETKDATKDKEKNQTSDEQVIT